MSKDDAPFGLSLQKLTPELRERYRIDSKQGLLVADVATGSEAERVELQPGDLIIAVNGKPVNELQSFKTLVKQSGARVLLRIEKQGQFYFVPLRNK